MQTAISPLTHSANEHAIVLLPSPQAEQQMVAIQNQLVEKLGDAIWLQRPPALHATLMEIICDTNYHEVSRKQLFDDWYAQYNQAAADILGKFAPFSITFDQLTVSSRAIIMKASDTTMLNNVRTQLLAKIKLPPYTKIPPDITHATLARFTKEIDLDETIRLCDKISVNITEHIMQFSLVKDLGPPDFNGTPLQTYRLRAPS